MTEKIQYKIQKGIFSFLAKNRLNIHEKRRILYIYAMSKGIKRPKKDKNKWYAEVSLVAQENFKEFKRVFNKHKPERLKSYDKIWNEHNLDGTFAYNNVTDDF